MNNLPVFHLDIWRGRDTLCFNQLTEREWIQKYKETKDVQIYQLKGQYCSVFCVTADLSITRQEALKCAVSFVRGWAISTEVNLETFEVIKTTLPPKINPPN